MPSHREFSEATLSDLLNALQTRISGHPDNPGLIAFWPSVREDRMAAACTELLHRGHPLVRVPVRSAHSGRTRDGWAVRVATEDPASVAEKNSGGAW
jgi:hypothetical protein